MWRRSFTCNYAENLSISIQRSRDLLLSQIFLLSTLSFSQFLLGLFHSSCASAVAVLALQVAPATESTGAVSEWQNQPDRIPGQSSAGRGSKGYRFPQEPAPINIDAYPDNLISELRSHRKPGGYHRAFDSADEGAYSSIQTFYSTFILWFPLTNYAEVICQLVSRCVKHAEGNSNPRITLLIN